MDRAKGRPSSLRLRIVSALVMAPVALAAVWLGGRWLAALVLAATIGMCWEWSRLATRGRFGATGVAATMVGVVSVAALLWSVDFGAACGLAFVGSVAVVVVAALTRVGEPIWVAAGTLWIALGAAAFLWLELAVGWRAVLWLLAVVWATDIGAYAAGRTIGGPKLAPRLSPNKTWAGLAGGMASAALAGSIGDWLNHGDMPAMFALVGAGLAVVAQLGDLAESLAKRHFGVKDASNLIPGHGGLLDRLDGLLAASVATALMAAASFPAPWF